MRRFKDKVILITGAGSGIGAATAKRFASEGAKLALVDIADLGDISAAIGKDAVLAITADVTDAQQVNHMVARTVDHFGRLDVLVNNAGVYSGGDPATISDEDWRKVIATDLDGVFYGCRAAVPHLEKTKGSIVNTASVSGTGGDWNTLPYNAAKGGVVNFTRSLAMDLGKRGIRVNAVCPSLTRTGMTKDTFGTPTALPRLTSAFRWAVPASPKKWPRLLPFWQARMRALSPGQTFLSMVGSARPTCSHRSDRRPGVPLRIVKGKCRRCTANTPRGFGSSSDRISVRGLKAVHLFGPLKAHYRSLDRWQD